METKPSFWSKLKNFFRPIDLTQGSCWQVILKFAVPILICNLLNMLYSFSDAAICGQTLSADEVAGVNDTSSIVFIFMQFAFGCTSGFSVILSNKIGAHDEQGTRRSFAAQIWLVGAITVFLTVLSLLILPLMLAWVNLTPTNPEVYNAAYTYCFVIFIGMFAQFLYNLLISVLRAIGDSFTPLMFLFISTVLNIVLDVAFIEAFHWGVAGAAVATVLTQFLCAVACFVYIGKRYNGILPRGEDFKVTGEEIWQHVKQGVPLGLQFSILSIGLIVMMSETVKFDLMPDGIMVAGNPAQNGVGAAHKLSNLVGAPLAALGVAMVSFNAQNIGAGRDDRVRKGTLQAVLMGLIASVLTVGGGMLFTIGGFYQYIFLSADKITERSLYFGNTYLYVTYVFVPLLAMVYVLRNSVQGTGRSIWTLIGGIGELIARVLVCMFLPALFNGGPTNAQANTLSYMALCMGDPAAWLLSVAVLLYPFFKYIVRQKKDDSLTKAQL